MEREEYLVYILAFVRYVVIATRKVDNTASASQHEDVTCAS